MPTCTERVPECTCAMTEASLRACERHGESAICADCCEPWTDHPATETRTSICDYRGCGEPISISIVVGKQRWSDVDWIHEHHMGHRAVPELRIACDATCPGCKYPEIGFAPARAEFVCSRCGHTQTERPKD